MEPFSCDSVDVLPVKRKISKIVAFVLILTTIILLILFDIVLAIYLKQNYSKLREVIEVSDNRTNNTNNTNDRLLNIEKNEQNFLQRIQALEYVDRVKDNATIEFIHQELNKTIDKVKSIIQNDELNIIPRIESLEHTDKVKDNITVEFIRKELNFRDQNILQRIEALESVNRIKDNVSLEFIHQEFNKTIDWTQKKIEQSEQNIMKRINKTMDLHFSHGKMLTFEQNGLCLDTMGRTKNESLELFPCHKLGGNQKWELTTTGQLTNRQSCVTLINATGEVIIDSCDDSAEQQWRFTIGTLRNPEYDMCLQVKERNITAAKCNPSVMLQRFISQQLYIIDRVCKFKQGSYDFPDKWSIANNGYFMHDNECLTYDKPALSYTKKFCNNLDTQKWEYTTDGQVRNVHENVCVDKSNDTIVMNECNSSLDSQRWICSGDDSK